MKKLFAALTNAPKRSAGLLMLAAAVIVPAVIWAWGPVNRPTYTYQNPAPHVTFNSMVETPNYGNELNFVRIKEATAPNSTYSDNVDLQPGKEYTVMVYFHNNAASHLNTAEHNHKGIALNTKMRVEMPATVLAGEQARITGFVSADNAQPAQVWDEVHGKANNNIALRYVANSATIYSNGAVDGQKLPDTLYTTGAHLGYDTLDGKLPGCNEYAGFVTFKIKVDQPNFEVTKKVAKKGTTNWQDAISANSGEEVEYRIHYKNTGTTVQNNVVIKDVLPTGVTYVDGSTHVSNAASNFQWQPTTNNEVTRGGLNIGNYAAGGGAYVKFLAKLPADSTLECGTTHKLVNRATAETNNGNKSDTADVTVKAKDCPPEPPKPKYTCDNLTVKKLERTKFEFTTAYTVENATFKHVTYVLRNASGAEIYRGTNNVYTQTTPGTYTVQAIVTVTVNGQDKEVTSDKCKATFKVDQPPAEPKYTCDNLTIKKLDRTKFEFTTAYTVENATFKHVTYVVKNAAGTEVYRGQNNTFTTETVGVYTVEALVTVTVNGADKTVTSAKCKGTFEVTKKPVEPKPGITITKKVNGQDRTTVAINQEFTYQLTVKNTGNIALTNVKVTDPAPTGVQFISADKGTIANNVWTATITELKVGESVTFAIKAKATVSNMIGLKNTACVDAPQIPGDKDDCDDATIVVPPVPVDNDVTVCRLSDKTIVTIKESELNANPGQYSTNLADCAETPAPGQITVCDLTSGTIVTIDEDAIDEARHTEDLTKCATPPTPPTPTPTPEIPTELPTTGFAEGIMAFVGLGTLVASVTYYAISRRGLGSL